jgi:hypothetical protein
VGVAVTVGVEVAVAAKTIEALPQRSTSAKPNTFIFPKEIYKISFIKIEPFFVSLTKINPFYLLV